MTASHGNGDIPFDIDDGEWLELPEASRAEMQAGFDAGFALDNPGGDPEVLLAALTTTFSGDQRRALIVHARLTALLGTLPQLESLGALDAPGLANEDWLAAAGVEPIVFVAGVSCFDAPALIRRAKAFSAPG